MNNRDELQFAYQIRRRLNADAGRLPASTLERLRAGREQALASQRQAVGAARTVGMPATFSFGWLGQLAPLAVLVGGLISINYWHQSQLALEMADVDTQVLVDELPPNAYLDKGFGAWLVRSGQ